MDRLEAFEQMLSDMRAQSEFESREMERLKAEGRERSATYRQYMGNRLLYRAMFDKYRNYGLLD